MAVSAHRTKAFDEDAAWQAVDAFLKSDHAAMIPAADITSCLYAAVAAAFAAKRSRRPPAPGDGYDIQQIGTYLPYVDVLIADRFFAQVAAESASDLDRYQGKVRRLGGKHIAEFVDWLRELVRNAPHAPAADKIYAEIDAHGSFRQFADRLTRGQTTSS
jgi:hypothetical protein